MLTPVDAKREIERLRTRRRNIDDGKSLPTTKELLRASGYMGGDLHWDLRMFADIAARRVRSNTRGAKDLKAAFQNLALEGAGLEDLLEMRALLKKHGSNVLGPKTSAAYLTRLEIYAASLEHPPAMETVLKECLWRAIETARRLDTFQYLKAAIGWHHMAHYRPFPADNLPGIEQLGENVLEAAYSFWDGLRATPVKPAISDTTNEEKKSEPKLDEPGFLTVLAEVANSDMTVGKKISDEFKAILKRPLPLVPCVDLQKVRETLVAQFPWASSVTNTLIGDIGAKPYIHHRPTILVGEPGSGKSRYCHRLYTLLNVPFRTFNCGGVADSTFSGTARQWSSGGPSLPLTLFRSSMTASPAVVLDEIEKASTNRTNGSLFDALLAMTEPESARCWYDPYVQAPLNLSGVLWMGTANDVGDIPEVLRDRFRILRFGEPAADHLETLARTLLAEIVIERGMRSEWARPLSWAELEALWAVWDGGSVRALKRFLEGVLNARESEATQVEPN
ncbi:MAG: AAA family ATPase [Ferrovibrio sp.]|uniref:AAA family ATPase n=1 Tax=Ferrovibrio sp. TaxID=1917215 RepID=UPI00261DB893|nr:AAA family ATPase [Ferrovibrio sp.]MCW0236336.1 AAA family ATPase [Ferrovibrio sp.]